MEMQKNERNFMFNNADNIHESTDLFFFHASLDN